MAAETMIIQLYREHSSIPWGFRLQGGTDFTTPLSIQLVNPGTVAENCGLQAGDAVLSINNKASDELEHEAAKRVILLAGDRVTLKIQRGGVKIWRPKVTPISQLRPDELNKIPDGADHPYVQKTSLAADKQESMNIGSTHNRSARPFAGFGAGAASQPPQQQAYNPQQQQQQEKTIIHNPYNTPMGLYSAHNIADSYSTQAEYLTGDLAGEVGASHDTGGYYGGSAPPAPASQAPTRVSGMRSVQAPVTKPPSERQQQQQHMTCKGCGMLVAGVFVKIKGEPYHPECFKCAACGKNLKQQGYFQISGQLYCEVHARQMAQPPGDDMVSVPVYR